MPRNGTPRGPFGDVDSPPSPRRPLVPLAGARGTEMSDRRPALLLALALGLAVAGAPPAAAAGASLVADIGTDFLGFYDPTPPPLFPLGGKVLFSDYDGIWASDGTSVGTALVRNTAPQGENGITGTPFAATARIAFFTAEEQLWRTDGTAAGTFPVGPAPSEDPGSI